MISLNEEGGCTENILRRQFDIIEGDYKYVENLNVNEEGIQE